MNIEKTLLSEFPGVEIDISMSGKILVLSRIVVPKEKRSRGIGTKIMQTLIDIADSKNIIMALTPAIDFGATSKKRLERFYRRFGFVSNKGRNKNFSTREEMIRWPNESN